MKRIFVLLLTLVLFVSVAAPAFANEEAAAKVRQYEFPAEGLTCDANTYTAKLEDYGVRLYLYFYDTDTAQLNQNITHSAFVLVTEQPNSFVLHAGDTGTEMTFYVEGTQIVGVQLDSLMFPDCDGLYGRESKPVVPATGDGMNLPLYLFLLVASAAAIVVMKAKKCRAN